MKVVADTNVFIAVALDEPEKQRVVDLTSGCELLAPEVLPFEIGNALTALMRKRKLELDEIEPAWNAAQSIPVELCSLDFREALRIAGRLRIYAYDAYFIECALKARSPFLTLDRRLRVVAADLGIEILE